MKCCSLKKKKDLMKHYNRMSQRYFLIGGIDDDNIRQIFLNSFPETLVTEVNKLLKLQKQTIRDVTIAQIYDYINDAVNSLCNQKKFFDDIEKAGKMLKESCNKDNFQIKCKHTSSSCDCKTKKKSHFKKGQICNQKQSAKHMVKPFKAKRKWKYVKCKPFRGKKSDKCFICHKSGHFAKNCTKSSKKAQFMGYIQKIDPNIADSDLESLLSLEDEATTHTIMSVAYTDSEPETDNDSPSPTSDYDEETPLLYSFEQVQDSMAIAPAIPSPNGKIKILLDPYDPPIPVVAYFDAGAQRTIMKPHLIPQDYWLPCSVIFRAANGSIFKVTKISKAITLQFFLGLFLKHQVFGHEVLDRDLFLGFDVLGKLEKISWFFDGLRFKKYFLPWTPPQPVFQANLLLLPDPIDETMFSTQLAPWSSTLSEIKAQLILRSCADSHTEFLAKCQNPLWKNPNFFISLPFKKK
ncbi:hypothetical protein LguiA_022119 [Lonicera macranthoides]